MSSKTYSLSFINHTLNIKILFDCINCYSSYLPCTKHITYNNGFAKWREKEERLHYFYKDEDVSMTPCLNASILEQDHPSVMTSHIVLQPRIVTQCISPPSTLKYANTVTIGISGQMEKQCPVLAGNSLQGSAASCRTHGLTMQQKERRVSTSYLGKINFLSPPVCCLRQNSCSVLRALCSPPGVQTAHQLFSICK